MNTMPISDLSKVVFPTPTCLTSLQRQHTTQGIFTGAFLLPSHFERKHHEQHHLHRRSGGHHWRNSVLLRFSLISHPGGGGLGQAATNVLVSTKRNDKHRFV